MLEHLLLGGAKTGVRLLLPAVPTSRRCGRHLWLTAPSLLTSPSSAHFFRILCWCVGGRGNHALQRTPQTRSEVAGAHWAGKECVCTRACARVCVCVWRSTFWTPGARSQASIDGAGDRMAMLFCHPNGVAAFSPSPGHHGEHSVSFLCPVEQVLNLCGGVSSASLLRDISHSGTRSGAHSYSGCGLFG